MFKLKLHYIHIYIYVSKIVLRKGTIADPNKHCLSNQVLGAELVFHRYFTVVLNLLP